MLVDEVYLDAVYTNTPQTLFWDREFVVTSSLTKVYGLSGLRCGWILAEPGLARAMWRLNDLFASIPAGRTVERRRPGTRSRAVESSLRGTRGVSTPRSWNNCHSAPEARQRDDFLARLRTDYETSAVPGHFFGLPNHFRVLGRGSGHGNVPRRIAENKPSTRFCVTLGVSPRPPAGVPPAAENVS